MLAHNPNTVSERWHYEKSAIQQAAFENDNFLITGLRRYVLPQIEVVDLLLERDDIDVNARDIHGCTLLTIACHVGIGSSVSIVRLLLSHGDTVNST